MLSIVIQLAILGIIVFILLKINELLFKGSTIGQVVWWVIVGLAGVFALKLVYALFLVGPVAL